MEDFGNDGVITFFDFTRSCDMTRLWQRWHLMAVLACHAALALASPTSEDYVPCHRQASWILQECLNAQPNERDQCWSKARAHHDACYADVVNSYRRRDDERVRAEKLLREKARQ